MTTAETTDAVRCAAWARHADLDPGGTAGTPGGFAVVDVPLPWPRDIGETEGLADVTGAARAHGLRVQARVPAVGGPIGVTVYRRPAGDGFTAWAGDGADVSDAGGPAATLRALVERPCGPPGTGPGEILLCTHGRRDTCCGSAGSALYASLTGAGASAAGPTVAGRPVRRTSHTGGHRFAPTAIVLPEGTAWAFADAELLERVVDRVGPLDDVVARYRGCTGLSSPAVQSLERAVLAVVGWPLLDSSRSGRDHGDGHVTLRVVDPEGVATDWAAEVVPGRTLTVPDCGRPLDEARKTETERVVRDLRQVR